MAKGEIAEEYPRLTSLLLHTARYVFAFLVATGVAVAVKFIGGGGGHIGWFACMGFYTALGHNILSKGSRDDR